MTLAIERPAQRGEGDGRFRNAAPPETIHHEYLQFPGVLVHQDSRRTADDLEAYRHDLITPDMAADHERWHLAAGALPLEHGDLNLDITHFLTSPIPIRHPIIHYTVDNPQQSTLSLLGINHDFSAAGYHFALTQDFCNTIVPPGTNGSVGFVEGRVRCIDAAQPDKVIFTTQGAPGLVEAYAIRNKFDAIASAEPRALAAMSLLAKEFGLDAVIAYLGLRMVPQWAEMSDPPPIKQVITDALGRFAEPLRMLPEFASEHFDYQRFCHAFEQLYDGNFTRYIRPDIPWAFYAEMQTTHEPILLYTGPTTRSPVQRLTLRYNLWRQRQLIRLLAGAIAQGKDALYVGGDVHVYSADSYLGKLAAQGLLPPLNKRKLPHRTW